MGLGAVGEYSPFGWSVERAGRTLPQVREEVRSVVARVSARWTAVFPEREGYRVTVASPAGASHGVQLSVERGGFRAIVSVESIRDPRGAGRSVARLGTGRRGPEHRAVRMYGRAEAMPLVAAERTLHCSKLRLTQASAALSVLLLVSMVWALGWTSSGADILAGPLAGVAGLAAISVGASAGAYAGEWVGEHIYRRALAKTTDDKNLQDDLRRWRALRRELAGCKGDLSGRLSAGPFRALGSPTQPRRAIGQARKPRPAISFFSSSF